jgi:hypothetical protein
VSLFTHWGDIVEQVWVKRRTDLDHSRESLGRVRAPLW